MKIVVVGTRGIPNIMGGVETHCEELFPRIAAKGCDVTLIRRTSYIQDNLQEYKGVKLADISTPKKKSFEAIIHTLKAVWAAKFRFKADIVHIHAIGPALLAPLARLLGLKVVFTHHGHDYDRDKWGKTAKMMLKFGERMGCRFADEVIVISEVINQKLKKLYNCHDANLIYNGVTAPAFIQHTQYLEELGISPEKYIIAMGRFVPEKNFHHLIEVFSTLSDKYQLVLAGDADFEDEYSKKLKEFAQKNNVVLTGFIKGEKLHALLTHARLFVLPSSHEGLPISLLEAMSYNLPVVASNIAPNININLPKECYFQVGDVADLTRKLQDFLENKLEKVTYPMEQYDWDTIAEQTMTVYRKIVAK
ncbi:MAG: glycosyltransferase family 4 protein [Prevotellaceae bacterium]|jgi:glycosyltransferase involved in cell wall biosynthesis|nr:glycosyltransferase family 4 protein [Prevotellaceae bacterium]